MLGYRLKILRGKTGLRLEDVANDLGMARSTYASYENGRRKPLIETIIELADYYNTSSDYLIGITDNPLSHKNDHDFKKYMENHDLSWNGVALTEQELKPIKDLLEIVVRDRLPKDLNENKNVR